MVDNPMEVYRSSDPELVRAYREARTAANDWIAAVHAWAVEVCGEGGMAYFSGFLDSTYVSCLGLPNRADGIPRGWRRKTRNKPRPGQIVPDKRSADGRAADEKLRSFGHQPSPRRVLPGMPVTADGDYLDNGSHRVYTYGVDVIGDNEDTLEITWSVLVDSEIDTDIWTRMPLSRYHAEREAQKTKEKESSRG